jgi:hypothetical protein
MQVLLVNQEKMDHKVDKVDLGMEEILDQWDLKVDRDLLEAPEKQEFQDQKVPSDHKDHEEHSEIQEQLANLDQEALVDTLVV